MINLYNQVPTIYSRASRDFQYLSWLINIVLNSVKHNVDDLYDLPNADAESKLSELLAFTLGFKIRRNYDKEQLRALTSIIPSLLRYKGTSYALKLAGDALIRSSGAVGECKVIEDEESLKNGIIKVFLPKDLVDMTLFMDLLPYILPAGMTCSSIKKPIETSGLDTIYSYQQAIRANWIHDVDFAEDDTGIITGVSGLFNADEDKVPSFANYTLDADGKFILNAGLLDNTVIPLIDNPLND